MYIGTQPHPLPPNTRKNNQWKKDHQHSKIWEQELPFCSAHGRHYHNKVLVHHLVALNYHQADTPAKTL